MRIGFYIAGNKDWQGGRNHLISFIYALKRTYGSNISLHLLFQSAASEIPDELQNQIVEVVPFNYLQCKKWTPSWFVNGMRRHFFSRNWACERFLKYAGIDIVFGYTLHENYGSIPSISWLPDMQHKRLPEMFANEELEFRDWAYRGAARFTSRIVLMSESVRKDFEFFFPKYADKARVLKTASYIPDDAYLMSPETIIANYGLPEKFIYLPNQFWKHKNHEVVFRALKILKDQGIKAFIVCSGYPFDYRSPHHFSDLIRRVSEMGLRDQVAFLGLVPKMHVLQLIRQSIFVINPSLFEGFGLTVDESLWFGKRLILSDIPSHRERNLKDVTYFNPYDHADLANKLGQLWIQGEIGPNVRLERLARESGLARVQESAESFMSVVRELVKE